MGVLTDHEGTFGGESELSLSFSVRQLSDGKLVIFAVRENHHGVITTHTWDATPGRSLAGVIADSQVWFMKTLVDHFQTRGGL